MNLEYKIDMIRLETKVENDFFMNFANRFLSGNPMVKHYEKFRPLDYRHNFEVHIENDAFEDFTGSFFLGFFHNMEKPSDSPFKKYKLVIEFNPNKVLMDFGLLNDVLSRFFADVNTCRLVSCDICTDIEGIPIDSVIVDRGLKRTFIDYQKDGGRGLYIGKRGSNGQVKVYNKAKELGMKDTILTRWECHLVLPDLWLNRILAQGFQLEKCLPKISFPIFGGQVDIIDDAKFRCIMHCIETGFVHVTDFERKYAKKIRSYLEDTTLKHIDDNSLIDLRKTIIAFFIEYYNMFAVFDGVKISQNLIKKEEVVSQKVVKEKERKNREQLMKKCQMMIDDK